MMRNQQGIWVIAMVLVAVWGFEACTPAGGDHPGSEYMPDMAHPIAYEANTYGDYYYNTWNRQSQGEGNSGFSRKELTLHNLPADGTVPRGFLGASGAKDVAEYRNKLKELRGENSINAMNISLSGSVPYYIPNTEEGRQFAATAPELRQNPLPITERGLAEGKELYNIYCGICHGEKGDGNGYLYDEAQNKNAKYLALPTNYLSEDMVNSENGRYYHAIMQGKGVMGSYRDKLSYEERWNVIHHIRSLQAKDKKLTYNQYANTLNEWATPIVDAPGGIDLANSQLARKVDNLVASSKTKKTLVLENVFFETGSAGLKIESRMELSELAEILKEYKETRIEVAGHTDNTGEAEANMTLSEARATAVRDYLVGKGIAAERLAPKGYGPTAPIASNDTEAGRAQNRRTTFTLLPQ